MGGLQAKTTTHADTWLVERLQEVIPVTIVHTYVIHVGGYVWSNKSLLYVIQ